ncbi:right-handed parallel beta-helix repeat-containing protein [bacterium]|nr:right-handed parallel beta-helix repeat-containing protein [bacterium]
MRKIIFLALFLQMTGLTVFGSIIYVPADQPTIQEGIDAASDGDTVLVADGIYTGGNNKNLDFNGKLILLTSENGAQNCIIDCEGSGRGIYLHSYETSAAGINGFTIKNGVALGEDYRYGGGVCLAPASATLSNCVVTDCFALSGGGGIYVFGSVIISNCTITKNSADKGGGISCGGNGVEINNCIIQQNEAVSGAGGLLIRDGSLITLEDCIISGNSCQVDGGGMIAEHGAEGFIQRCTINDNTSFGLGGGIYFEKSAYLSFVNNLVSNNSAFLGGGIYIGYHRTGSSNLVIGGNSSLANQFIDNSAMQGVDLFCEKIFDDPVIASHNNFSGLHTSQIYVSPQRAFNLENCTSQMIPIEQDVYVKPDGDDLNDGLSWNTAFKTVKHALSQLGATNSNPLTVYLADGVYSSSTTGETFPIPLIDFITLSGTTFDHCIFDAEGADHVFYGWYTDASNVSNLQITGAVQSAVFCYQSLSCFEMCKITGNSGEKGGGVYLAEGSDTQFIQCVISGNIADAGGGIYCMNSSPLVTACEISGNEAQNGGGIFIGTTYSALSIPVFTQNSFLKNSATELGGAVYCKYATPIFGGNPGDGNNFASNKSSAGADLYLKEILSEPLSAQYNTFMGYYESDYYVSPVAGFALDGSVSEMTPIVRDVFVSPVGSDSNDGLTSDTPFRTISHAVSLIYATEQNPITIHLAAGTYSSSTSGEIFPLPLMNHVTLACLDIAILDAEGFNSLLIGHYDVSAALKSIVLTNTAGTAVTINYSILDMDDCSVSGNNTGLIYNRYSDGFINSCDISNNAGVAVQCDLWSSPVFYNCKVNNNVCAFELEGSSSPIIDSCEIIGNSGHSKGAIYCWAFSDPLIVNTKIMNTTETGILCNYECKPYIANCIIAENEIGIRCEDNCSPYVRNITVVNNNACGISCWYFSSPEIRNCIVWAETGYAAIGAAYDSRPVVTFSNVRGGYHGQGNINSNPLFVSDQSVDYYLSQTASGQSVDSPCLDSGGAAAQATCYDSSEDSFCLDMLTTRTDGMGDTGTVDMGYHHPLGEPTPTPSPTATILPLGIDLVLSDDLFEPGEDFSLDAIVSNPGPETYMDQPFVVVLDVLSNYYWYPHWSSDFESDFVDIGIGTLDMELLEFVWPGGAGTGVDCRFYAAIVSQDYSEIIGVWDMVTFSWTN